MKNNYGRLINKIIINTYKRNKYRKYVKKISIRNVIIGERN